MATPRLDQFILSLIKVESATDIPIVIEKVNYVNNSFLNANNDELTFGLELEKGDSCQGKFYKNTSIMTSKILKRRSFIFYSGSFFLKQTGNRDPQSSSIDLGKIRVWWRRLGNEQQFSHVTPLGYLPILSVPDDISIKSLLPPELTLHEPFSMTLNVHNGKGFVLLTANIYQHSNIWFVKQLYH